MIESMGICDELAARGKYLASSPLQSVTTAATVRVRDGEALITDGPFAETTEQLGGYYVLDLEHLDEAIAVASKLPPVRKGTVEIRPLYPLGNLPPARPLPADGGDASGTPYMLLCYDDEAAWRAAGAEALKDAMTEAAAHARELSDSGRYVSASPLHSSETATCVRVRDGKRAITDGPFAETNEVIAGFWLWKVKSMAEAIEWVKRCPNPMLEDSAIEIRPVFEADDFGEAFTPELREQEAAVRAKALGLGTPTFRPGQRLLIAGLNESYTAATRGKIPEQWQRLAPHLGKVPGQVGEDSYGVCWKADSQCNFEYLAGVAVSSPDRLPAGFKAVEIDSLRYAVFGHAGHVSEIPATIAAIWTKWAPDCGLRLAHDAPCFERYTDEFDARTGLGGMEIWIPLEG
jgi:predicted transcriptional regulator YdeE